MVLNMEFKTICATNAHTPKPLYANIIPIRPDKVIEVNVAFVCVLKSTLICNFVLLTAAIAEIGNTKVSTLVTDINIGNL